MVDKLHMIKVYWQTSLVQLSIILAAFTFSGFIPPVYLSSQASFGIVLVDDNPSHDNNHVQTFSEQFYQLDKINSLSIFTSDKKNTLLHFNNLTNVLYKAHSQKALRHKIVWTKLSLISFFSYSDEEPKVLSLL